MRIRDSGLLWCLFCFDVEVHMGNIPFLHGDGQLVETFEQAQGLTGQLYAAGLFRIVTGQLIQRNSIDIGQMYQDVNIRSTAPGLIICIGGTADAQCVGYILLLPIMQLPQILKLVFDMNHSLERKSFLILYRIVSLDGRNVPKCNMLY